MAWLPPPAPMLMMSSCEERRKVGVTGGGRSAWPDLSMDMEMYFGPLGCQGVVS